MQAGGSQWALHKGPSQTGPASAWGGWSLPVSLFAVLPWLAPPLGLLGATGLELGKFSNLVCKYAGWNPSCRLLWVCISVCTCASTRETRCTGTGRGGHVHVCIYPHLPSLVSAGCQPAENSLSNSGRSWQTEWATGCKGQIPLHQLEVSLPGSKGSSTWGVGQQPPLNKGKWALMCNIIPSTMSLHNDY